MTREQTPSFLKKIISIAIVLNICSIIFILTFPYPIKYIYYTPLEALNIGIPSGPQDLDPIDSIDSSSELVIEQVAETLFTYNLSNSEYPLINFLAESYIWINSTTLEITIRQNVTFHDGTSMDAEDCVWNFDRLSYLCNYTGELPVGARQAKTHSILEFPNGKPILNNSEVINSETFRLHLNTPFAPFLSLLTHTMCSILSPDSTPFDLFLDINDDLIGTGPYEYGYYDADKEVQLFRYDEYWQDPVYFDLLVFTVFTDQDALNTAMAFGDMDYIIDPSPEYFDLFNISYVTTLHEHQDPGLEYSYLGFNNQFINSTWRKSMSYSINYTYIIEEMLEGRVSRSFNPISPGFSDAYDSTISDTAPYYNLTYAREIVRTQIPEAAGRDPFNDSHWGLGGNTLVSFNYSYNEEDQFRADLYHVLRDWFSNVSINLIDDEGYFDELIYGDNGNHKLQIFWMSWTPAYIDPSQIIILLFLNNSSFNYCEVNDTYLENMITEIYLETDNNKRNEIYHNISHYLVEDLLPHAFICHPKVYTVHRFDLYDVPYNPFGKFYAYPIKK